MFGKLEYITFNKTIAILLKVRLNAIFINKNLIDIFYYVFYLANK